MISDEDLHLAIDRIARSNDGHYLYLWLQKKLTETVVVNDLGTLARHQGERILAATLMELMRDGLIATGSDALKPVVLGKREQPPERPRNYREWAAEHDPEYIAATKRPTRGR